MTVGEERYRDRWFTDSIRSESYDVFIPVLFSFLLPCEEGPYGRFGSCQSSRCRPGPSSPEDRKSWSHFNPRNLSVNQSLSESCETRRRCRRHLPTVKSRNRKDSHTRLLNYIKEFLARSPTSSVHVEVTKNRFESS